MNKIADDKFKEECAIQIYPGKKSYPLHSALIWKEVLSRVKKTDHDRIVQELELERDFRPNISVSDWNSDYSQRPTRLDFNKEQTNRITAEKIAKEEQDKNIGIVELEEEAEKLVGAEMDLDEFIDKHAKLEQYFKKAGLLQVWEYVDENLQDYFLLSKKMAS